MIVGYLARLKREVPRAGQGAATRRVVDLETFYVGIKELDSHCMRVTHEPPTLLHYLILLPRITLDCRAYTTGKK